MIKISGTEHPLVFSFDAIAIIEHHFDQPVLDVQRDQLDRMEPLLFILKTLLDAGAKDGEFTGDLNEKTVPPVWNMITLIRQALHLAYFGTTEPEGELEDETEKK